MVLESILNNKDKRRSVESGGKSQYRRKNYFIRKTAMEQISDIQGRKHEGKITEKKKRVRRVSGRDE